MTVELHALGAMSMVRKIAQGETTSEAVVRNCLDYIRERDPSIAAWAWLDPGGAIERARARDRASVGGLLHGVPVGFKDIIDTFDMPTAYGSPIYREHHPAMDASSVALARAAGAVLLGKTVTTEFAFRHPGPTRNPHNPLHSPGGSSSGSAAAVADLHVPLAVGTQTAGSVIRPAAYCGTYAMKPTFNAFSFAGVRHLAESFDTLGCMARSLEDLALFRAVLQGIDHVPVGEVASPPRIAFCRTPYWSEAQEATRRLHEEAAEFLARAGAKVIDLEVRDDGARLDRANWTVNKYEGARTLLADRSNHPDSVSSSVRELVDEGRSIPFAAYRDALALIGQLRTSILEDMGEADVILTPSAVGEAPHGLNFTGPITFNFIWTATGMPAITLPMFTGPAGLPIGMQLVGRHWEEDRLLAVARWIETTLGVG